MPDRYITISTQVSLASEWYDQILQCAHFLELSVDEVLRAVVNTSVRRHFEHLDQIEEVSGDA